MKKRISSAEHYFLLRAPDYLAAQVAADNEDAANIFSNNPNQPTKNTN